MDIELLINDLGVYLVQYRDIVLVPLFNNFRHEEVAIGLALFLLIVAFLFGIWFLFRHILPASITLKRLLNLVTECDGAVSFKESYPQISMAFNEVKFLRHGWAEFTETLLIPNDGEAKPIRNTQRPGQYLNTRAAEAFGPRFHFYQALPNYFVGVGLLLTFFGLVAALYFASEGIKAGSSLTQMQSALRDLLHAATFKFLTSISGLFSSIILSVIYRLAAHHLQLKFDGLCDALEHQMVFVYPEILLSEQLQEQQAQTLQLERFNTDFAIELSRALEERLNSSLPAAVSTAVQPLTDAVRNMAGSLGEMNQDALSEMVGNFKESLNASAGSEMQAIANTLEGIRTSLGSASAGVSEASSDFGRRVEDAAIQLEKAVSSAGGVLQERADEASNDFGRRVEVASTQLEKAISSAGTELQERASDASSVLQEQILSSGRGLSDSMQETGQIFSEQLRNASSEVGESLLPLAEQIGRFETIISSLDSRFEAQREAMDGMVQNIRNAGSLFTETANSLKAAGEPIAKTAEQFTISAEHIGAAGREIKETQASLSELTETIGSTSEVLSEAWGNYEQRFKDVDDSLAKVFNDLVEASDAHRTHIQNFVQELDKQFDNALKSLGGGIEQLQDSVEDLTDAFENKPAVD
jgi:hypothetical protein